MEMNNVRVQASKLSAEAAQLAEVRSRLRTYRSELETCWQGAEVTVLLRAVDQALAQVTAAEKELQELANTAQEAAKAIRAEEQAAAKAAAEREKQQRQEQQRQEEQRQEEARRKAAPAVASTTAKKSQPAGKGHTQKRSLWDVLFGAL